MKRTVANTPINRTQLTTSDYIGTKALANLSDDSKVHMMHKAYANDLKECRQRVKAMKTEE